MFQVLAEPSFNRFPYKNLISLSVTRANILRSACTKIPISGYCLS